MVFLVMYVRVRLPSLTKIPQYNFNFFSGLFQTSVERDAAKNSIVGYILTET